MRLWVRSFSILFIAVACHAGVYDSGEDQPSAQANRNHNAFFFEASAGVQYLHFLEKKSFPTTYYDWESDKVLDGNDSYKKFFEGYGPDFSFKFGGIFKSHLAVFGNLGISSISGKYRYDGEDHYGEAEKIRFDTDAYRFFLGAGVNYYFVADPQSALYGLYAGAAIGFMADYAGKSSLYLSDNMTEFDEQGFSFAVEAGKLWRVWDAWHMGVYGRAVLDAPVRFVDVGDPEEETISYYALSAGIVFARK